MGKGALMKDEYPIWRIPNTAWTVRGAADLFAAEYFLDGTREVTDFNNEELTFKLVGGNATYEIMVTNDHINVFRQKEK